MRNGARRAIVLGMSDETEFDYQGTQDKLLLAAGVIHRLDIKKFLAAINHSETVTPFLDPTLFMRGHRQLALIREIARAAVSLKKATAKFAEEYPELEWDRIQGDLARGMPIDQALDGGPR